MISLSSLKKIPTNKLECFLIRRSKNKENCHQYSSQIYLKGYGKESRIIRKTKEGRKM
jgi:hypothetical protein